MHPHAGNLKDLSVAELEQKITKLNRIYFMADNESVRHQVILLLDDMKLELEERRILERKRQMENNPDDENGLDSLIKVS